jgi:hypothetical protein
MSFFKVGVCAPLEYAVWQRVFLRPGLFVTFRCACAACACGMIMSCTESCRKDEHTRLNFPLLSALHRFFVPLWVLSFGKLATVDVEKSLAVATKREKNMTDNVKDFRTVQLPFAGSRGG